MSDRVRFENQFLAHIPLDANRQKYVIRCVENDMNTPAMYPIPLILQRYWDHRIFSSFDTFWNLYRRKKEGLLIAWQHAIGMGDYPEAFWAGAEARVYRIWTAVLTQIQGAYVLADMIGEDNVEQTMNLDLRGIDIRVTGGHKPLCLQIKKASHTGVRSAKPKGVTTNTDEIRDTLRYQVPQIVREGNLYRKDGENRAAYDEFLLNGLEVLENGFVIFTEQAFIPYLKVAGIPYTK